MRGMAVTVVGGGIIGLSCALRLAQRGHDVTVVSAGDALDSTSAVAGGLIYPRHAEPVDRCFGWTKASYAEFSRLAELPDTGVRMLPGRLLRRSRQPVPPWAEAVGGVQLNTDVGPPWVDAVEFRPPLVNMPVYLQWLTATASEAGVRFEQRVVDELPDEGLVVNAAGLDAGRLARDDAVIPARGQLVHLPDPGLAEWVVDEDDFAYVLPHGDHVVCGGTEHVGDDSLEPDEATTESILRRCTALVPALAGLEPLAVRVGLRPWRPEVRLDREGDVIHCYGLGGVGVTLSWGCADEVADLAEG